MNENEKAIACISATPITKEQSQENNLNLIISEKKLIFNGKVINPLEVIDGKTLLEKKLPPINFIIEKIMPQGLFILAGSPKVGKSWLSLDFCQTVSMGGQIWDLNATKGTVLYLALEDSLARLQTRLKKITSNNEPNLFFSVRALKIQNGLTMQITDFINEYPDTNLVVIDTMQHIRNNANDKNAYVSDYNDMNVLRQITNQFNVSLILVTHTRKLDDPDPLNIISGSTGLVGAVDGVFILEKDKRTGNNGKLTITNRDTESYVFTLEFDNKSCRWNFVEEEPELHDKKYLKEEMENVFGKIETNTIGKTEYKPKSVIGDLNSYGEYRKSNEQQTKSDKGIKKQSILEQLEIQKANVKIRENEKRKYEPNFSFNHSKHNS